MCFKRSVLLGDVEGIIISVTLDPFTILKTIKAQSGEYVLHKIRFDGRYLSSGEDFKANIWIY